MPKPALGFGRTHGRERGGRTEEVRIDSRKGAKPAKQDARYALGVLAAWRGKMQGGFALSARCVLCHSRLCPTAVVAGPVRTACGVQVRHYRWDCAPSAGCDRRCRHKSNGERESRASLAAWRGRLFLRRGSREPGWSGSGRLRHFGQSLPIRSEGQRSGACACWAHASIAIASTRVQAPRAPLDDVPAGSLVSS